jgi:regulator of protease activity HflC (stomatin/prohibitin superfamily)
VKKQKGFCLIELITTFVGVILLGIVIMYTFFMHSIVTEDGFETVLLDQPYFGTGGIRPESQKPGRVYVFATTKGIPVDMRPINIQVPFEDLPTNGNGMLDFKTSVQVRVTDSVALIKGFGLDWFNNNLRSPYESSVRDISKSYTMTQIMSDAIIAGNIETSLMEGLSAKVKEDNLPIVVMDFNLGQGRPNPKVVEQMDKTNAAQQESLTYIESDNAEQKRLISERSRAAADSAYAEKMGFSPEQVIQMDAISKYSAACSMAGTNCVIMAGGSVPVTLGK